MTTWIVARTNVNISTLRKAIDGSASKIVFFQPVARKREPDGKVDYDNLWFDYILFAGDAEAVAALPVRIIPFQFPPVTDEDVRRWQDAARIEEIESKAKDEERKDARTWAASNQGKTARIIGGAFTGIEGVVGDFAGGKSVYLQVDFVNYPVSVKIEELEITNGV